MKKQRDQGGAPLRAQRRLMRAVEQLADVTPLDAGFADALNEYRDARDEREATKREVES